MKKITLLSVMALLCLNLGAVAQEKKPTDTTKKTKRNLQDTTFHLQEIQISTGYQTLSKERATGSFTHLTEKELARAVTPDLLSRLKGVANGLLFDSNVGNSIGINIRGRSTIFSNTAPLIVIDNFPFEGDLNTINPDMVESVTLLKDAAAAAIWGVRAGNGVLVITTKKGRFNTATKVNINTNLTIGGKPDLYYQPQLTSSQYIDVEKFLFDKGAYTATINNKYGDISEVVAILQKIKTNPAYAIEANARIAALRNIDVRDQLDKYFYRNSALQYYSAEFTGGAKNQSYNFSAGYNKNIANTVAKYDDRITLKANNNYKLLNEKLKINTDITFSKSRSANDFTTGYTPYSPYELIADQNGDALATIKRGGGFRASYTDTAGGGKLLDWKYRPLEELRNKTSTQNIALTDYRLAVGLSYQLVKALSFSLNYQYYNAINKSESSYDKDSYYIRNLVNTFSSINSSTGQLTTPLPYGNMYNPSFNVRQSNYGRAQLSFNQTFNQKHELSAITGYEIRDDAAKRNAYTVYGYRPETGSSAIVDLVNVFPVYYSPNSSQRITANTNQGASTDRYISYYGNASYSYIGKYVVSGSYRKDESNLFGVKANQKGVPLWSAGLAWNIHKESFFNLPWFSSLQLKGTYGYNGNVNNNVSAYLTATSSTYNPYGVQGFVIVNPPYDELKWERVKNLNVGIFFATKNNAVDGSIEYFVKDGIDLIATTPVAPQTGISLFTGNAANTNTKGLDIQINSRNINRGFKWNTTFILNYVKDKITDYKVDAGPNSTVVNAYTNSLTPLKGYAINSLFAYKWAGLNSLGNPQGFFNNDISTDYAAIRNATDRSQLQYFGSATPTVFGSVRNTFMYKGLELSANLLYKLGYRFRRPSLNNASIFSGTYIQRDYDKRWQVPGDEALTDVPALVYPNVANRSDFYNASAVLVEKGDYVRFQDIRIGYSLQNKGLFGATFNSVHLYAYINNLGLIWAANKQNIDPDVRTGLPVPRTYAMGLKIIF